MFEINKEMHMLNVKNDYIKLIQLEDGNHLC